MGNVADPEAPKSDRKMLLSNNTPGKKTRLDRTAVATTVPTRREVPFRASHP